MSRLFSHARKCPNTLVIEELGLDHGASRVDIAVINGHIRGIEIKAEADSLDRLPAQALAYGAVVERATLLVAEKHLTAATKIVDEWWGLVAIDRAASGAVRFRRVRAERANPTVNPLAQSQLLWRPEALDILSRFDCGRRLTHAPRSALYQELVRCLPPRQLGVEVRQRLKARKAWRDQPAPL